MKNSSTLVVLITGASSGLGAALAREHARLGHRVVVVARQTALLKALAQELPSLGAAEALALKVDVTRRVTLDRAVRLALQRFGRLDVVYANAGYGLRGDIAELDLAQWRQQQAVNVEGVLNTVWASQPALTRTKGRLGLVGSVLGFGAVPGNGAYAASKFAVRAIAQALGSELAASGVSVTHIAPGFFDSRFRQRGQDRRFKASLPDSAPSGWSIPAEEAAGHASRAVMARRRQVVFPWHGRFVELVFRFFPDWGQRVVNFARGRRKALPRNNRK